MTEINRAVGERPTLEWVPIELIGVDNNYQRPLKNTLVAKILRSFRWDRFGALVLSRQDDGRFTVVEGQHRLKAAELHPDVTEVPAIVVKHDERAAEAVSFLSINRDRMAVTSIEQYWAGLTAGDEHVTGISRVLHAAGCDVVPENGAYKPNLTNAVGAIGRCLQRYGHGETRRALLVIRAAWPAENRALRGTLITALARVIRANKTTIDDARLTSILRPQSIAQLTAHAEGFRKLSGGSADTALTKTLVELYNKGKRTDLIEIGAEA